MRQGDDPRDIYWRKCTVPGLLILRERAREMRHDVDFVIDNVLAEGAEPSEPSPEDPFERRIREVASFSVAHVKRGDRVTVATTGGDRVVSDRARGTDPILRFLALLGQVSASSPSGRRSRAA